MKRRQFIRSLAGAGTGVLILPRITLFGADAPSNKLNIALIGTGGRGLAFYAPIADENVVALCDVNENNFALALKKFPDAKTYIDWRKLLDNHRLLRLDAIICCTADHTHAFIANWAMNRKLHVFCEKPLANSVEEARVVRATYLKNKNKLATKIGTQRRTCKNFDSVRKMILEGAIGELTEVCAWGNRQIYKSGYPPALGEPPANLHYDLWLGPSPLHPYNPEYFSGGPGANALNYNMYWDFGTGQLGDMGTHTMDLAWNAIDAVLPTSAEAKGDPFNPEVTPVLLEAHFEHPANHWRPSIRVSWYQGGAMPPCPSGIDLQKIDHGVMFTGKSGYLVADFSSRQIYPSGKGGSRSFDWVNELNDEILYPARKDGDLTDYKPGTKVTENTIGEDFIKQWINACKENCKTDCNFEYAGNMMEMMLLGLVAYRVGKKLTYDGVQGRVTNVPEANNLLSRSYRSGWTLNG